MNYALFLGCNIPARVTQYQDAATAVCQQFDIHGESIEQFNCCGYPMRNMDEFGFIQSAARNLAISEQKNMDIMALCKCCYGSLKLAQYHLKQNAGLLEKVNANLQKENLSYKGSVKVKHLLSVLFHDVGIKKIKETIRFKYKKLKIAASVGCHALRPAKITRFDDPVAPSLFDELVKVTGAQSIVWSKKSECCGAPLLGINDILSKDIMKKKLSNAREAGAHFVTAACPYSYLQFDTLQSQVAKEDKTWETIGTILYPQLLGLSMGIDPDRLGIREGQINIDGIESYLSMET